MIDCKKSHLKCKGCCCGICPIPKEIFDKNKNKIVREVLHIIPRNGPDVPDEGISINAIAQEKNIEMVVPLTEDAKCCFLNQDLSCNIYEDRPKICRKFGDESHPFMTCLFQSKEGRIRSRQETRGLERNLEKYAKKMNVNPLSVLQSQANENGP